MSQPPLTTSEQYCVSPHARIAVRARSPRRTPATDRPSTTELFGRCGRAAAMAPDAQLTMAIAVMQSERNVRLHLAGRQCEGLASKFLMVSCMASFQTMVMTKAARVGGDKRPGCKCRGVLGRSPWAGRHESARERSQTGHIRSQGPLCGTPLGGASVPLRPNLRAATDRRSVRVPDEVVAFAWRRCRPGSGVVRGRRGITTNWTGCSPQVTEMAPGEPRRRPIPELGWLPPVGPDLGLKDARLRAVTTEASDAAVAACDRFVTACRDSLAVIFPSPEVNREPALERRRESWL